MLNINMHSDKINCGTDNTCGTDTDNTCGTDIYNTCGTDDNSTSTGTDSTNTILALALFYNCY